MFEIYLICTVRSGFFVRKVFSDVRENHLDPQGHVILQTYDVILQTYDVILQIHDVILQTRDVILRTYERPTKVYVIHTV